MMTLGGSPTAVAAPPMLVKMTSAIRTCLGSRLSTSHNLMYRRHHETRLGLMLLEHQCNANMLHRVVSKKVKCSLVTFWEKVCYFPSNRPSFYDFLCLVEHKTCKKKLSPSKKTTIFKYSWNLLTIFTDISLETWYKSYKSTLFWVLLEHNAIFFLH